MINLSLAEFLKLAKEFNVVPVFESISLLLLRLFGISRIVKI